ncbi:MAG: hypothetical protein RLZZ385_2374 [Pseudomonadota bacterium]|jgi:acyl-CoA thioester hydrolase
MALAWDLPAPFVKALTVSSGDIDGLGHVNNAAYVVWCEQCAWQHSESLGLSVQDYQRLDRGVAIHTARYTYYRSCRSGEPLLVGTWLVACDGKLRLQRRFQIVHGDTGETVLRGYWQLVSVVLSSGKPVRMPRNFAQTYGAAVTALNPAQ